MRIASGYPGLPPRIEAAPRSGSRWSEPPARRPRNPGRASSTAARLRLLVAFGCVLAATPAGRAAAAPLEPTPAPTEGAPASLPLPAMPAQEPSSDEPGWEDCRYPLLLAESAAVLIPPMIYYWSNTSLQREDWELRWDWPSWVTKLTSLRAFALDTGYWDANAIRHPIAGALAYQVARANGLGPAASTVVDLLSAATWEYVVEFKERVSVNDLVTNSLAGFLLGEPLFQLGRLADRPGAGWARHLMGWVASPVHRLHVTAGSEVWRAPRRSWTLLEFGAGGRAVDQGHGSRSELALEVDLELVRDPRYGSPGNGARSLRAGGWSHVQAEVRLASTGASRVVLGTSTLYGGTYRRHLAEGEHGGSVGTDSLWGLGGGLAYESRRLPSEWDHSLVFNTIGPRLALGRWNGRRSLLWETGAYADVAMVRAHVFGPVSPFVPVPQRSVLQVRGYYYAVGASLRSRLRWSAAPWYADLDLRGHLLWSIDGYDRIELDGADGDPHGITDQRLATRAALGVQPTWSDVRFELAADATVRRGAWSTQERVTAEADVGVTLVAEF